MRLPTMLGTTRLLSFQTCNSLGPNKASTTIRTNQHHEKTRKLLSLGILEKLYLHAFSPPRTIVFDVKVDPDAPRPPPQPGKGKLAESSQVLPAFAHCTDSWAG